MIVPPRYVPVAAAACHPRVETQPYDCQMGRIVAEISIVIPVNQLKNLPYRGGARRATQWYCPPEIGYLSKSNQHLRRAQAS
jgi:hypothetical protein